MKTIIKDVQGLVASLFPSIHRVAAPSHRRLRLSLLTLLLTLSITQAWGNDGDFYNMYISYSVNGNAGSLQGDDNGTGTSKDLGTLSAGNITLTGVYLKCWDDWGSNYKSTGGLLGYTNKGGSAQELLGFTRSNKPNNSNNYEWQNANPNLTIASYTDASGSYAFECWGKTWGWGDRYFPKSSGHYVLNYKIAPPAVSGFGITVSGYLAGNGTSGNPYLVKSGTALTITVAGSKAHTDANSTMKYWINSGSKHTSSTLTISNITATINQTAAVHAQCINNSNSSLVGTEGTTTIYYKAVSVKDITVYVYVGDKTDTEAQSVEMNGCTPYVGTTSLAAVRINTYNSASSPKFTKNGNWLEYTFTNVTQVTNITCARSGGNIFTGTLTDDKYITYDGTALSGKCIAPANPTWGTAPASASVGSSTMTATVSGAPAGSTITWTSTTPATATVSSAGVITYFATGTTTIKANVSWAATGDYCAGSYELSKEITVTSGATVSATLTTPEYVATGATNAITLNITSTGASTEWKYRIRNTSTNGYQNPDNQSAASNSLTWTMTSGVAAGSNPLVVELWNATSKVAESSTITVTGETAHPITIAAGAGGTVSPSGTIQANSNHVKPSITATPNTGYNFVNWTTSNNNATVANANNASTSIATATGACTITANFALKQTAITIDLNSGTAGATSVTAIYGSALPSFTAATRTNYTLQGYYTATSGGTKIINANGTLVASTAYADATSKWISSETALTLHAQWAETTYTVNVAVGTAGAVDGTTDPNGNAQVGAVTPVAITAPTPRTGYVWSHWEATTGITIANQNDISTTITATQAGNVRAIYDEDLTTGWYLRGGSAFGGSTWEQDYQFMKRTGASTTSIAYYVVSISSTNNVGDNGDFQFKIRKGNTGNTLYGLTADGTSWWYYRSSGERTMNTDGKNIELLADVAGDYEFKIDYSNPSSPKITVTYPPSLTWSAASVYSGDATINVSVGNIVSGKSLKYELFAGATATGVALETQNTTTTGTTATTTFTVDPAFATNEISKQYTVKITYNGTQTATYTSVVGRKWDIKVHDVCSWGSMKIYMWDAAGAYPTAFPGTDVPNLYGTWYTVTLDGRYPNFNLVKGSDSSKKSNDHTASLSSPGGYPAGTYYYLRDCNTLSPVTPTTPTVDLIIVDDQISTNQISLTGHITNCGNDGTTAAEMKEVGFYFGSTKYVATCTNDTYFYATVTGLTAETNYVIKAYAENIKGVGESSTTTKSTRTSGTKSIKVRQSSGSTQLKIYAWTDIANNCAGGKLENATFPGENMTRYGETQWWTFDLDNRYTHFIISQGTEATKTANISTPDGNACYDYNISSHALTTRECWEITGIDDSYDLYTSKTLSITPTVIDPAGETWHYKWTRQTGSNTSANGDATTGIVATANATIASTAAEDATFEFKVIKSDASKVLATKTTTIHSHEPITITTKVPNNNGWSMLKYHYWGSMNGNSVAGAYKGGEYLMEADGHKYYSATFDEVYPLNFLAYDGTNDLLTYADDQKYRMTLNVTNVSTSGCYLMSIADAGTGSDTKKKGMILGDYCPPTLYRVKVELPDGQDYGPATWRTLYSNAASVGHQISYFAAWDATLTLQKLESGNWTNLTVALSKPANRAENGIYQANVATDALSSITQYTGDLYVRSFLATGGWEDYLNPAKDNVMTKFTPESDYNYYWVKYTGEDENKVKTVKNVYVTVGNPINPQLTRIINDGDGKVNDTGNVKDMNIRYSYNSHNNILNIAAIGGAVTASPIFLTVYGKNGRLYKTSTINEENKTLPGSETNHGEKQKKFNDVSNWVYQADVYANVTIGTNVTAAVEARLPSGEYGGTGTVQTLTPENGLEVLGDNTTTGVYKLRLLYDYKTNTITTGWLPTDGQNITDNTVIEGNMIINRKENNSVEQINITGDKTVSGLHKLYMALEVTKKSCFTDNIGEDYAGGKLVYYWFSLPYDCRVEDIMGAPGKYPDNWEIWEYDGEKRAKEGLLDNASFFKTVPFDGGILQANKGYCLGLYVLPGHFQNVTIDGEIISSIYIYFPSRVEGYTLKNSATKQLVVPAQYDEEFFTRRPDRKKYDRDWNLMGVPSYNDITSGITATDAGVEHTHEAASAPGFIYDYLYTGGIDGSSENNKYKYIPVNSNAAGFKYKAFFSYMMQYAGTITWTSNSIENIQAAPAPRKPVRTGEHQLTQATLNLQLLAGDEWLDNTFVSLLPKATDKVDHNIDLVKIWNSGSSQLCSLSEDIELAANCLSVDSQTVDLRVYIDNTRTYTFRLEEKVPDGLIALLEDTEAHTLTDLGSDAYNVDLMQGTYDSRFRLHLIVGSSDIGTDIDQLTNSMSYTLYGNELLLNALTEPIRAALYDPAGRLLYQGIVNPGNTINLPDQAGVYLLRLPTQTLRIVK